MKLNISTFDIEFFKLNDFEIFENL